MNPYERIHPDVASLTGKPCNNNYMETLVMYIQKKIVFINVIKEILIYYKYTSVIEDT